MYYKKQHISQQLIFANLSVQEGFMASDLIQLIDRFQTFPCRSKCLSYLQRFFFKQDITKCCEESVWVAFAFPDGETGMWRWIPGYLEALELSTIPIVSGPPPGTAPAEQSACLSAEQTHCLQLPPAWSGAQRFPLRPWVAHPPCQGPTQSPWENVSSGTGHLWLPGPFVLWRWERREGPRPGQPVVVGVLLHCR